MNSSIQPNPDARIGSTCIDWSKLYHYRRLTQKRYPQIWNLPIKKRHHQVIIEQLAQIDSLLELGAGARNLYEILKSCKPDLLYRSYDIDNTHEHDFYQLDDIEGDFDAVCMFEVIEHIKPEEALETLAKAFQHTKPNGLIFVSTPNTFHPPEYLRDATHITPWCYDELGAILQLAGFQLETIYRLYQDSLVKKLARRIIFQPLFRLLGIDFSKQILAVARKPA